MGIFTTGYLLNNNPFSQTGNKNAESELPAKSIETTVQTPIPSQTTAQTIRIPDASPLSTPQATSTTTNTTDSFIQILSPQSKEKLCLGKTYDITWKASSDIDVITILLVEGEGFGAPVYTLGSLPSDYEGNDKYSGKFSWIVGKNRENKEVVLSPGYKIILRSSLQNGLMEKPFTISNC